MLESEDEKLYKLIALIQEWYEKGSILIFVEKQAQAEKEFNEDFKQWVKEGYVNDDTIDNYLYWVEDWYRKEKEKDEPVDTSIAEVEVVPEETESAELTIPIEKV